MMLEIDILVICVVFVLTTDADHVFVAVMDLCYLINVNDDDDDVNAEAFVDLTVAVICLVFLAFYVDDICSLGALSYEGLCEENNSPEISVC